MTQPSVISPSVPAAGPLAVRPVDLPTPDEPKPTSRWHWALVVLVILASALLRGRFLEFPLERDEGEYAYSGQLILQGIPPYQFAYNMKLPGVYAAYAVLMAVFGQTTWGIHAGLILVNGITIVLVFLLGRRLFDATAGTVACAAYAWLSACPTETALAAHATHFVTVFEVAGALVLLRACKTGHRRDYFVSGLLFGLGFLMKQHALAFVVFGGLYCLGRESRAPPTKWRTSARRLALFGIGAILPFMVTCVILARLGVLERCLFWTVSYASEYVTQKPLAYSWGAIKEAAEDVGGSNGLLWLLAVAGLAASWWEPARRPAAVFVAGLLFFGLLSTCPGLYFRGHYFIVILPAIAILIGAAVTVAGDAIVRRGIGSVFGPAIPALVFGAVLGWSVWRQRVFFFVLTPEEACREIYHENPFIEAVEVAKYLKERTTPQDRIGVLGSEPEINFYSGRRSASGYIYMYPLVEDHPFAIKMQREAIAEFEANSPKFVVVVPISMSWLPQPNSISVLDDWWKTYHPSHYDPVGVVVSTEDYKVSYHWNDQPLPPPKQAIYRVFFIFKRKPGV